MRRFEDGAEAANYAAALERDLEAARAVARECFHGWREAAPRRNVAFWARLLSWHPWLAAAAKWAGACCCPGCQAPSGETGADGVPRY